MSHPGLHVWCGALVLSTIFLGLFVPHLRAAEGPPAGQAKEPLPVNVFRSLEAGRKQAVVVYGTSLTASAEWPKALKGYFEKHFPGQVTFVNAAKSGEHSNWGVANLEKQVLAKKPDLVFIEFSINDAVTRFDISTEKSAANLDAMVKALRQQNPQVEIVLQTMNPVWDAPDVPAERKSASNRPRLADYYEVYRKYAHEHGLPLVDHYANWLKLQQNQPEKFKKWLPDGTHPTPEASVAVTFPAIQSLLEKARAAAAR